MLAARTFAQEARAGIDVQFVGLEFLDEGQFRRGEFAQRRPPAQRAFLTRCVKAVRPPIPHNHIGPCSLE